MLPKSSRVLLISAFLVANSAVSWAVASRNSQVVLLSDIHFNPFAQCSTADGRLAMKHLLATGGAQWGPQDFAFQTEETKLGEDSNFRLLASALKAAHDAAPAAKLVVLTGDLLSHSFHIQFEICAPVATDAQFTQFAANTMEFVTREVADAFPRAQLVPVLGNNDTDAGDYKLPSAEFLKQIGEDWQKIVVHDTRNAHADFSSFGRGGYYTVALSGWKHVRAVVVNSVAWSGKFSAAGRSSTADGDAELEWLQSTLLAADKAHNKVLLLGHIPPGLDAFATRLTNGKRIVSMYRDCGELGTAPDCRDYAKAVPAMMQRFSSMIAMSLFGHTHQDEYRVIGEGLSVVAAKVVPSISPIYKNNPAFLIADVTPGFTFSDYTAWNLPLSAGGHEWKREYSFDATYAQPGMDAVALASTTAELTDNNAIRARFFALMSSGNAEIEVPLKWQDSYICGLTHMTAQTVLPCVAETQLDIPLP